MTAPAALRVKVAASPPFLYTAVKRRVKFPFLGERGALVPKGVCLQRAKPGCGGFPFCEAELQNSSLRRSDTATLGGKAAVKPKNPPAFGWSILRTFFSLNLLNLKSREIISISEMGLPSRHTEPSASLLFPKGDEPFPAVGKAQLYPNHPAVSASYTSCTVLSRPSAF